VSFELVTPRLVLRPFAAADVDDLQSMDGDDRVMRYIGTGLAGRTREQTVEAIGRMVTLATARPGYGLLHASRRQDGAFVGGCGLFPMPEGDEIEIAYRLPYAYWGHGYATEMARSVLAHGFETLQLVRIVGVTFPENGPSQQVLRNIGMREEAEAVHYGRRMRVFAATRGPAS
jgi:RimJ/RimL family protein N-acetyltransferase